MDGMKTEPNSDSDTEPASALCETEFIDIKEEDSSDANGSHTLGIVDEDIKVESTRTCVDGIKTHQECLGTKDNGGQQEYLRQMEVVYIKQELDDATSIDVHRVDAEESSSRLSDKDVTLCSRNSADVSMNHDTEQTLVSEQFCEVTSDTTAAHDDSNSVTGGNSPRPATLPFISADDRGLIGHFTDLPHVCYICNKGFGNRVNLRRHYRIHTEYQRFDCKDCDKSYRHLIDLKRHALIHSGEQPYSCDVCSKSFSRITHLRDHTLTHTGERPHVCKICSKTFSQASNLQTHQLTHTGERPHICPVCGKSFSQRANLQTHSVLHSGTRPHVCKICGKGFHRRRDLQNHCVTHTGERPHVCPVCKKTFALLDNLRKHSDLHSGKRPHECKQCGKTFAKKYDLNRHARRHIEDPKQDK